MAKKEVPFCDMCKKQIKLEPIEMPDPNRVSAFVTVATIGSYEIFGLDVCSSCRQILHNLIELFPDLADYLSKESESVENG